MPQNSNQILSTDWQVTCIEMRQRGTRLLQSGVWSDCSFLVGAARELVSAHRLILAMSSPVFQAMFSGVIGVAHESKPILVPDMQLDAFKLMLEYIYTDNINLKACSTAYALYSCAHKYKLPHLRLKCVSYLVMQLSPQNACSSYEFAESAKEEVLKMKCLEIIKSNSREALAAKSFERLHVDTVEKIFSIEPLNIDSELDLLKAAERYARAQVEAGAAVTTSLSIKKEVKPTSSPSMKEPCKATESDYKMTDCKKLQIKDEEKIHPLRKAIKQIRFLALKPQEFSQLDCSSFLSVFEINAIALNLISDKTHAPMPSGFSTSRIPRNQVNQPILRMYPKPKTEANRSQIRNFHTKIFDIKYLLGSSTDMFEMHNMTWRLDVNPWVVNSRRKSNSLDIFVTCLPRIDSDAWCCQAKLIVRINSHKSRTKPYRVERVTQFTNRYNSKGWNNIIRLKELMDPENGYVLRNAITVHVQVRADEPIRC